jgi:hypothetical protein
VVPLRIVEQVIRDKADSLNPISHDDEEPPGPAPLRDRRGAGGRHSTIERAALSRRRNS